jgi:hypothetical protein
VHRSPSQFPALRSAHDFEAPRDYGNRAGAWYLHDAFDALQVPMAALVNSSLYDYAPALIAAHRARADEIVGHGRIALICPPEPSPRLIFLSPARGRG